MFLFCAKGVGFQSQSIFPEGGRQFPPLIYVCRMDERDTNECGSIAPNRLSDELHRCLYLK